MNSWFRHVGVYAYRRDFLLAFSRMEKGTLEQIEGLEQLRALENGFRIRVVNSAYKGLGIDTQEDYTKLKIFLGEST